MCDEANRFAWPGPDLRPIRRGQHGVFHYGTLPAPLLRQVFAKLAEARAAQRLRLVPHAE